METIELIRGAAWVVNPLMSKEECYKIIQLCNDAGIQNTPGRGDKRHRNNFNHKFVDGGLSSKLWDRLRSMVPSEYSISEEPCAENDDKDKDATPSRKIPPGFSAESAQRMTGTWVPYGVNTHFSALLYKSGGHFGPHRDSHVHFGQHEQSILTVAIYLNDRLEDGGGATHFLRDDMEIPDVDSTNRLRAPASSIVASVKADLAGKAVIFHHDLLHEGGTLSETAEPKWLLVTQVLYRRDPMTAPQLSSDQLLARQLMDQAEKAETEGKIPEAIHLYNRAFRLDPTLDGV